MEQVSAYPGRRSPGTDLCGVMLQRAVAEGFRPDTPAGDAIRAALPKWNKPKVHRRALPFCEMAGGTGPVFPTARPPKWAAYVAADRSGRP